MAGSGKNEYEEWKLYVFPARKNFPGVAMMVLFVRSEERRVGKECE